MTNGEKIRGMNDKDLALWLCENLDCCLCPNSHRVDTYIEHDCNGNAIENLQKWLKSECEFEK